MNHRYLTYVKSLPLRHHGDCRLLGVRPDRTICLEEIYGDQDWLAQHCLSWDGRIVQSYDEHYGTKAIRAPLSLPTGSIRPLACRQKSALDFSGPRWRGLRESERTTETLSPLTIVSKMMLVERLKLSISPPMLLGIAESRVLAEALIAPPKLSIVCRRLRLAYALPHIHFDDTRQPYDYDTLLLYLAHEVERSGDDNELLSERDFAGLPGVELQRPMDCMVAHERLLVAEGGTPAQPSAIHIWDIHPVEHHPI